MSLLAPGDLVFARYEVESCIGSGGFGAVYKAHDRQAGSRLVALKQILPHVEGATDDYVQERFFEECEVLRGLEHPNIPRILDYFNVEEEFFLVMQHVAGVTLDKWLVSHQQQRKPVAEEEVIRISLQVLDVLVYLHGQPTPLIHRDIKPPNIILRPDNSVMLVDFGMARRLDVAQTSTQIGTVGFAPREQIRGHPEPCSDLYAVGATMYYLLAAKTPPPFSIPPVEEMRPDISPELAAVVNKATQDNPVRRPVSASRMRQSLLEVRALQAGTMTADEALERALPDIRPESGQSRQVLAAFVTIGALVVGGGLLGIYSIAHMADSKLLPPVTGSPAPHDLNDPEALLPVTPPTNRVVLSQPAAEVKSAFISRLSGNAADWQVAGVLNVTPDGRLQAPAQQTAAIIIAPPQPGRGAFPLGASWTVMPRSDLMDMMVICGDLRVCLTFDKGQLAAGLYSPTSHTTNLIQSLSTNSWATPYLLYATPQTATLGLTDSASTVTLSGNFNTDGTVKVLLIPIRQFQDAEIQNIDISSHPPPGLHLAP